MICTPSFGKWAVACCAASLLIVASCKKKDTTEPTDTGGDDGIQNVLADGSGFRNIYTYGNGGVPQDIEVPRNSAELCVAWWVSSPYMTDFVVNCVKVSGQDGTILDSIRQAKGTPFPSMTYVVERAEFMPFSDSLYWTNYIPNSTGGYWNFYTFSGVIATNFYGSVRRAFTGEWVSTDGWPGVTTMMHYPNSTSMGIAWKSLRKNALEPVNTTGDYVVIGMSGDSAYAAFVTKADPYSYNPEFKQAIAHSTSQDLAQWTKVLVRRSRDGSRTGFAFQVGVPGAWRYYTFTCNNTTKQVSLVHNGISLARPYPDWTAYDIDPEGNIYHAGRAASAANGFSVYKVSASGTQTIGKDNMLQNGASIELVRYIDGKVYIGTTFFWKTETGMAYPGQMNIAVQQ